MSHPRATIFDWDSLRSRRPPKPNNNESRPLGLQDADGSRQEAPDEKASWRLCQTKTSKAAVITCLVSVASLFFGMRARNFDSD